MAALQPVAQGLRGSSCSAAAHGSVRSSGVSYIRQARVATRASSGIPSCSTESCGCRRRSFLRSCRRDGRDFVLVGSFCLCSRLEQVFGKDFMLVVSFCLCQSPAGSSCTQWQQRKDPTDCVMALSLKLQPGHRGFPCAASGVSTAPG